MFTLLDLCVSSLRRGHADILCIVIVILTDDPRRESHTLHLLFSYYVFIRFMCYVLVYALFAHIALVVFLLCLFVLCAIAHLFFAHLALYNNLTRRVCAAGPDGTRHV